MDYEYIKTRLAPCGLHCGKCFAFVDGDISQLNKQLKCSFGDFEKRRRRDVL